MIETMTILATYGDDQQAVIVCSADTHPAANAVVAELLKVKKGKITLTEVIYDATPFSAYIATGRPH